METSIRNIEFRLYPAKSQEVTLVGWLRLHCELYNAAIQERRDAYRKCGISITYNHQQNDLPMIKEYRPELIPLGSHALQETVRRVDRAFRAFFRRVKAGNIPGYPRFKSKDRFDSFCYPDPAGWKIKQNKLRVSNLGEIPMRGKPRIPLAAGTPRTLTIKRQDGKWFAICAVEYPAAALRRNQIYTGRTMGMDVGCSSLAVTSDGDFIDNPKTLKHARQKLTVAQKNLSRKTRGSKRRAKARCKVSALHGKVARKRKDFLHQLAAAVVSLYSFVAVEKLLLSNMTRSARGTAEKPGRNVKQKAGLNRSLLDASIGMLFSLIAYKAEEAGAQFVKVAPNHTSQNCFWCGQNVPKELSVRMHVCPSCGFVQDRDYNAALNILAKGLVQTGWEPSEAWSRVAAAVKRETATMPLAA
jgi:putative transposase